MNKCTIICLVVASVFFQIFLSLQPAYAFGWPNFNDNIFPPAASAKADINFDGRGFLIHGKRIFIVAGEVQYSRIPRAEWRDRLLRVKRAGYNTIQTYTYWNFHEPREGQFDFTTGNHDLDAYLKLIHSLGMYAIVRIGPYVNSEWDSGGLPVWLRFKKGLLPMTDNEPFYKAVTPYWNRLLPIIVHNQITQGGPIIMVQLENEHVFPGGVGGGTDIPNAYYSHYQKVVLKAGLKVPYFFSGLNHNDKPAGNEPFDTSYRASPWYSSEFWTGWLGWYGLSPGKKRVLVDATWKIIAYGGAGYSHYMMVGGSDFHTWNNNEQAASYDFGAPVGQAGDFRADYYPLKRAALFATSFSKIFANSVASSDHAGFKVTNPAIEVTTRHGPNGAIYFLHNLSQKVQPAQFILPDSRKFPTDGPMEIQPGEFVPSMFDYPLVRNVTLTCDAARILGVTNQDNTTTVVIFGQLSEPAELHFLLHGVPAEVLTEPDHAGSTLTVDGENVTVKARFISSEPIVFRFRVGKNIIRVLAMTKPLADRTWFVPVHGETRIICGPDYVGDVGIDSGNLVVQTEQHGLTPAPSEYTPVVFGAQDEYLLADDNSAPSYKGSVYPSQLYNWKADTANPEAQPSYDTSHWLASKNPLPMGADGGYGAYAWYRCQITVPKAEKYSLNISDAGDWLTVFVNGINQASTNVQVRYLDPVPRVVTLNLNAGNNQIAILTAHYGRNKLFNYYGSLRTIDAKGISGTVTVRPDNVQIIPIQHFVWKADADGPNDAKINAVVNLPKSNAGWLAADTSTDVFHGQVGYAWFRTTLPHIPGPQRRLYFSSIDDSGNIYVNGKLVAKDVGINADRFIDITAAWNNKGKNTLAVLVHNTGGAGGLLGTILLQGNIIPGIPVLIWKMRGGVTMPTADSPLWKTLNPLAATNVPTFYRAEFQAVSPTANSPHPILRVETSTLSRGFVWLNGHNLGRYPEVSRDTVTNKLVDGIYLQECWLKPTGNILTFFDEDGASPAQVRIVIEEAASRTDRLLIAKSAAH